MSREKSVKVKEVITSLCKLLSALSVESIPTAEAFRRAKFNRKDAAVDMWSLLSRLLQRAVALDCACGNSKDQDFDVQLLFVRSALCHCGYGATWVVGPRPPSHIEEVGSRDLLLAFSWVLSSGNLLDFLLAEKVHQLETLSSAPTYKITQGLTPGQLDVAAHGTGADTTVKKDQVLQELQWQYGKLRLQWKSLLSAQEERSKFTHRVISNISPSAVCQPHATGSHHSNTTSTALDEDSVIDSSLADASEEEPFDWPPGERAVTVRSPHGDETRRAVRQLDKMLLRLQTELRARRIEQSTLTLTSQGGRQGASRVSESQRMEVEKKVSGYLEGLRLTNTSAITSRGFLPCLQDPQPTKPPHRFHIGEPGLAVTAGKLQASTALDELREREAVLQWQLEQLRENMRVEIQRQASTMEGMVLIPPLKR
ncbi:tubulin epsilon and delta complex protein 1 isoform X2 [Onychostoma macrolepis]|uniref:tubulin epsilon and delta complex protein 1 isoform X2 n=1 Tax=Onychostoma macrolepis TaxID=369639 RepID=UPI00272BFA5A|nr:tubulin epsilon and delta complex protein 1 isoform X2 [Onychostoma macrolepis]